MVVTGEAAGHPNVRATHSKTLELAREADITARATCVVGVAARLDEDALARLHGRVELTLSVGGESETVAGRLNPAFRPGDPLVVRRAPAVTRDALLIDADRSAADLPRSFVALLARPAERIAIRVAPAAGVRAPAVLVLRPGGSRDVIEVCSAIRGKTQSGRKIEVEVDLRERAVREAIHAAHDAGATVLPAPGLSLIDAVRAVGGLGPDTEVTEDVAADALPKRLAKAERDGAIRGAVVLDPGTPREEYLPWRAGQKLRIAGARGRRAAYAVDTPDEGAALERARAVADRGGSTRDVTAVLREAGVPRRRAYELALELTASTSTVSRPEPRTSR
jgi:hypothetical protein